MTEFRPKQRRNEAGASLLVAVLGAFDPAAPTSWKS